MRALHLALTLGVATWLAACTRLDTRASSASPSPSPTASPAQAPPGTHDYDFRGRVTAIKADGRSVTLDHEAIPGLMPAMQMVYAVPNPDALKGLAVGDLVQGRMHAEYTILSLSKR